MELLAGMGSESWLMLYGTKKRAIERPQTSDMFDTQLTKSEYGGGPNTTTKTKSLLMMGG